MKDKYYENYKRKAEKDNSCERFRWSCNIEEMNKIDDIIIDLVPKKAKILECGCGDGRFAKRLISKRNDITFYHAFDFIEKNIEDARMRKLDIVRFYRANYWDELLKEGEWNFIISQGVLFTHTEPEFKKQLMNLVHNTSKLGFMILTIVFVKPNIKEVLKNSINILDSGNIYFKNIANELLWLIREDRSVLELQEIPKLLLGLPDQNEVFDLLWI